MRKLIWILILLAACSSDKKSKDSKQKAGEREILTHELEIDRAMPIDVPYNVEPSGLVMRDDTLFTISDDHDNSIFYVDLSDDRAVLREYYHFESPKEKNAPLDLEGITVDEDGIFYLVSERMCRILKVDTKTRKTEWVTPDLRKWAKGGMLSLKNGSFEGITYAGRHRFYLAAERESRGIMRVDLKHKHDPDVKAWVHDFSIMQVPNHRSVDYAGLHFVNGKLFALERSAHAITEIRHDKDEINEMVCWSYSATENAPQWRYRDMEFGHAEGLYIDESKIYVILDNNGDPRNNDSQDRRPLLFIFHRP